MIVVVLSFCLATVSYLALNYYTSIPFKLAPWNIEVAMLGIPFYTMGNVIILQLGHARLCRLVSDNKVFAFVLMISFGIIVYVGSGYNGSISFGHADMGRNVFVTYICAFLGVVMMLVGCILLDGKYINQTIIKIKSGIKWFGQNSFYAMAIHKPLLGFVLIFVDAIFRCGRYNVSGSTKYSLVAFLFTLLLTIIGIIIINIIAKKCQKKYL